MTRGKRLRDEARRHARAMEARAHRENPTMRRRRKRAEQRTRAQGNTP